MVSTRDESLLQGLDGVVVYLDDILVTGSSEEAHLRALEEVLRRLERARLKVKQSKCTFMRPSVTYLGHRIDAKGLHPLDDRVRAIEDAPTPTSVSGLKSYLGVLSYYNKFLPNLSSILHPIHRLLRKDTPWVWGVAQSKAFAASMKLLTSLNCLTHFDSSLELTLACDASNYGLGAVYTLSQDTRWFRTTDLHVQRNCYFYRGYFKKSPSQSYSWRFY